MKPPKTNPSTPKLSEVARHVVIPDGIVTTAWPRIVAKCAEVGAGFDSWQHGIGSIALGKRSDGKYAATVGGVVLSIPRQVGKTYLVGMIVIALCLLHPGMTVLWTAHRTRTATMTFQSLKALTSRKKIKPHTLEPRNTNGEQEIRFCNGSVIMFGAREMGFGRGFDEVDIEVFDEAQILTEKALEDMVPAANQSRQPAGALLFFMGTPPRPTDPGEEFSNRRKKAIAGKTRNAVYVEFSADKEAKLDDQAQWRKANPSYPTRTPLESMERMRENLTDDDSFRREALGIWDETAATEQPIPVTEWDLCQIPEGAVPVNPPGYYSLSISPERMAYIGVAIRNEDKIFLDLAEASRMDDSRKVIAWFVERRKERKIYVAIDSRNPAAALINELRANKIRVNALSQSDSGRACVGLASDVGAQSIEQIGQDVITKAMKTVDKKLIGKSGQWEWNPDTEVDELAALQAITNARFGLTLKAAPTEGRASGRRAVVG